MFKMNLSTLGLSLVLLGLGAATASALPPCTVDVKGCAIKISCFGKCCLNAGGFQSFKTPPPGQKGWGNTGTGQCGAEFKFLVLPCARSTGAFCGGTQHGDLQCE